MKNGNNEHIAWKVRLNVTRNYRTCENVRTEEWVCIAPDCLPDLYEILERHKRQEEEISALELLDIERLGTTELGNLGFCLAYVRDTVVNRS